MTIINKIIIEIQIQTSKLGVQLKMNSQSDGLTLSPSGIDAPHRKVMEISDFLGAEWDDYSNKENSVIAYHSG